MPRHRRGRRARLRRRRGPRGPSGQRSTDVFATDRTTAGAVNGKYLPADAEEKEGLVNKWPFNAEKKDYPYWDGLLGDAVDAVYDSTETSTGWRPKYHVSSTTPAEIVDGVQGIYSPGQDIWVEPRTGAIVNQTQHSRGPRGRSTVLDLQLGFTEEQVAANVDSAEDNKASST